MQGPPRIMRGPDISPLLTVHVDGVCSLWRRIIRTSVVGLLERVGYRFGGTNNALLYAMLVQAVKL